MRKKTATVERVAEDLKELVRDAKEEGWTLGHDAMEREVAMALGEEGNDVNYEVGEIVARMKEERDEFRRDSERLDWLNGHVCYTEFDKKSKTMTVVVNLPNVEAFRHVFVDCGADLRAVIDTAMPNWGNGDEKLKVVWRQPDRRNG